MTTDSVVCAAMSVQGPQVGRDELGLEKQILGGIAGHGQLGKGDDIGAQRGGLVDPLHDPRRVPGDVAYSSVDLSQGQAQ